MPTVVVVVVLGGQQQQQQQYLPVDVYSHSIYKLPVVAEPHWFEQT
jgi:hypothetical protein